MLFVFQFDLKTKQHFVSTVDSRNSLAGSRNSIAEAGTLIETVSLARSRSS